MVLQQGKLGVGTDAPQGRFSVADEPHNLEEFPPRAMTGYKNYFEGHGEFCASSSGKYNTADSYPAWTAFDKTVNPQGSTDAWISTSGSYDDSTDLPTGIDTFLGIPGSWLKLSTPNKYTVKYITLLPRVQRLDNVSAPGRGKIYGSNDDKTWTILTEYNGLTYSKQSRLATIHVNSEKAFKYFVILVEQLNSGASPGASYNYTSIGELRYFGTREQGQSVLHDGQLTLTKNLNVPRIGPPLDADDTPRRDRLVVEYNTSTNPTFDGAVRDTSGRGLDGVFYGGASYDASQKALGFDGVDDYVQVRINNTGGDYIHSVSWWFKTDITTAAIGTNEDSMWSLGDTWSARVCSYSSFYNDRMYFAWNTYNINCATTNIKQLQWNHACVTYTGGGSSLTSRKIYINGIVQTSTLDNAAGTLLNLPANTLLTLGNTQGRSTFLDGSLSQFKLYDTALTAEEVKTLYDMGRTGSVANPQPLHIAAPLYSPGTTVQLVHRHVYDYHTVNSNNGLITPMNTSITPKFSSSKILVQMMVNGEGHHDATFRILRYIDGSSTGVHMPPDTVQTPAHTDGIAPVTYDGDNNSTMGSVHIMFVDTPNTTGIVEYKLYYKWRDSSSVNRFSLNQVHADATASYTYGEHTSSSVVLQEIAH